MKSALLLLALVAPVQDPPPEKPPEAPAAPAPAQPKTKWVALLGGDVQTVTKGLRRGATVLLKDGKIHRIGADVEIPEGAETHDVKGRLVLPGFVAANARGLGFNGFSRSQKIADALDPYHESIKMALAAGITSAYVEFGSAGGFFGGRTMGTSASSAVIKMAYGDLDSMLVAEPASMSLGAWMTGSLSQRQQIRDSLTAARDHIEKSRDYETRKSQNLLAPNEKPPAPPQGGDVYVKLLKGETIARMSTGTADEIRRALSLVGEFRFPCVLVDVDEGWTMADEIGRSRCWAIVTPRRKQYADRSVNRPTGTSIEQPAILHRAGVKFAVNALTSGISTGGLAGRDLLNLNLEAGFAIRGGLGEQAALESITITAAELCGVAGRLGSLEEGKDGDVIVLSGDPFHYRTHVEMTFVDGRLLYERSKSPYFSHLK